MILYQDGLIQLDYNPARDILTVKWPDIRNFPVSEIEHSFKTLISTIRHYDIKLLLIDSGNSNYEVTDEQYKQLVYNLLQDFNNTRLQKIARVQSGNAEREMRTARLTNQVDQELQNRLTFQNFDNAQNAVSWLLNQQEGNSEPLV